MFVIKRQIFKIFPCQIKKMFDAFLVFVFTISFLIFFLRGGVVIAEYISVKLVSISILKRKRHYVSVYKSS